MSSATAIPDWNTSGIIPPIRPGEPGHSAERSPYKTTLIEIIDRFGTSSARLAILEGYFKVSAEIETPEQLNEKLNKAFKVKFDVVQVGQGRPKYTLPTLGHLTEIILTVAH